jgi:hypothetical protein
VERAREWVVDTHDLRGGGSDAGDIQLSHPERTTSMPLFMDVHSLGDGVTMDAVAQAHRADLATQDPHGVNYLRYWVDEHRGQIFCLVEAPDAEAANTVHRDAHGLVADAIYEVQEGV